MPISIDNLTGRNDWAETPKDALSFLEEKVDRLEGRTALKGKNDELKKSAEKISNGFIALEKVVDENFMEKYLSYCKAKGDMNSFYGFFANLSNPKPTEVNSEGKYISIGVKSSYTKLRSLANDSDFVATMPVGWDSSAKALKNPNRTFWLTDSRGDESINNYSVKISRTLLYEYIDDVFSELLEAKKITADDYAATLQKMGATWKGNKHKEVGLMQESKILFRKDFGFSEEEVNQIMLDMKKNGKDASFKDLIKDGILDGGDHIYTVVGVGWAHQQMDENMLAVYNRDNAKVRNYVEFKKDNKVYYIMVDDWSCLENPIVIEKDVLKLELGDLKDEIVSEGEVVQTYKERKLKKDYVKKYEEKYEINIVRKDGTTVVNKSELNNSNEYRVVLKDKKTKKDIIVTEEFMNKEVSSYMEKDDEGNITTVTYRMENDEIEQINFEDLEEMNSTEDSLKYLNFSYNFRHYIERNPEKNIGSYRVLKDPNTKKEFVVVQSWSNGELTKETVCINNPTNGGMLLEELPVANNSHVLTAADFVEFVDEKGSDYSKFTDAFDFSNITNIDDPEDKSNYNWLSIYDKPQGDQKVGVKIEDQAVLMGRLEYNKYNKTSQAPVSLRITLPEGETLTMDNVYRYVKVISPYGVVVSDIDMSSGKPKLIFDQKEMYDSATNLENVKQSILDFTGESIDITGPDVVKVEKNSSLPLFKEEKLGIEGSKFPYFLSPQYQSENKAEYYVVDGKMYVIDKRMGCVSVMPVTGDEKSGYSIDKDNLATEKYDAERMKKEMIADYKERNSASMMWYADKLGLTIDDFTATDGILGKMFNKFIGDESIEYKNVIPVKGVDGGSINYWRYKRGNLKMKKEVTGIRNDVMTYFDNGIDVVSMLNETKLPEGYSFPKNQSNLISTDDVKKYLTTLPKEKVTINLNLEKDGKPVVVSVTLERRDNEQDIIKKVVSGNLAVDLSMDREWRSMKYSDTHIPKFDNMVSDNVSENSWNFGTYDWRGKTLADDKRPVLTIGDEVDNVEVDNVKVDNVKVDNVEILDLTKETLGNIIWQIDKSRIVEMQKNKFKEIAKNYFDKKYEKKSDKISDQDKENLVKEVNEKIKSLTKDFSKYKKSIKDGKEVQSLEVTNKNVIDSYSKIPDFTKETLEDVLEGMSDSEIVEISRLKFKNIVEDYMEKNYRAYFKKASTDSQDTFRIKYQDRKKALVEEFRQYKKDLKRNK